MRILSLTAGAAGMHCGACMRDNALATELIRQGHDVLLVPIYTPTRAAENEPRPRFLWQYQRLPAAALGVVPPPAGMDGSNLGFQVMPKWRHPVQYLWIQNFWGDDGSMLRANTASSARKFKS
ncbi:MAG: hypothetical protein WKF37_04605 [Bryobacteraceae bacterium]